MPPSRLSLELDFFPLLDCFIILVFPSFLDSEELLEFLERFSMRLLCWFSVRVFLVDEEFVERYSIR